MHRKLPLRRSSLFLLSLLAYTTDQAQLSEWADQRTEEIQYERVLPIGGDRWAIIGKVVFGGANLISVRNADGSIDWEDISSYFTTVWGGDVALLPDSGLLQVGALDQCDYVEAISRVRRYARDGTVLWERLLTSANTGMIIMAAKGTRERIAVASEDSVHVLDLDGILVDGFQAEDAHIHKLHWKDDSTLFLLDGPSLRLVDLDGDDVASQPVPAGSWDMHFDGQQLFVLSPDSVRRFTAELVPLGTTALPTLNTSGEFVVSEDALFVRTTDGLYELSSTGVLSLVFAWPFLPAFTTTNCAVRHGVVMQVGMTDINGYSTGISRLLSMQGEATQHDDDVEVLVNVDSAWTEYHVGYWTRRADISGRVVNHGATVLHSVVQSMWIQVPYLLCSRFVNRIDTAGFSLALGDTLDLPFGAVDVGYYYGAAQAADTADVCIVALAPNNLADRHPEDNSACASADFVLNIEETPPAALISVSPNPASDGCMLQGLARLGTLVDLQVLDATGRIVLQRSLGVSSATRLDIGALPSAAYTVVAQGERSSGVARLIVAH